MKKASPLKKVIAILLAVMMVATVAPISAFAVSIDTSKLGADMILTSKTSYAVAPGITEMQITTNNSKGSNQSKGYAMEVDLNNPTTGVIASYKNQDGTSWGMQTVRDQASAAEKKYNVNVVGGVNADFYNMQTGAPLGALVMQGITYNKSTNRNYFAILNDGTAVIGSGKLPANVKEAVGGDAILVSNGNITPSVAVDDSYVKDVHPRTVVGITADGKVVLYVVDGRQAPVSAGMTYRDLAYVMLSLGCISAINLDGGGSSTYLSSHEGSDELVCRNSPSDGMERIVSSALLVTSSAKPNGVFDHAALSPNNIVYTPGTSVQFNASGVDSAGAAADLPDDGVFALADDSFGTITDDGLFVSNGKTGTVVVNYVSEGSVCGNVSITIAIPDDIHTASDEISLGFEETTDFNLTAKYQQRDVVLKAEDIQWTIVDGEGNDLGNSAGTFDGLYFTSLDGVTVTAYVTATLVHDPDINTTIKAVIGAMPVLVDGFEYTTDLEEAANNPDLEYIPSYEMPNYDHDRYPGGHLNQVDEFIEQGYPYYSWPNAAINFSKNAMKTKIVSKEDGEPVRFGEHSMKITFDFSEFNNASNANCYLRQVKLPRESFEGTPTAFGAWIYIPEGIASALQIYLQVANKSFSTSYGTVGATAASDNPKSAETWTGWKYVELDLTDASAGSNLGAANAPFGQYPGNGILWISYQPGNFGALKAAASIYIDNMQLVYGANTDDVDNPVIKSVRTDDGDIADGKTVLSSNVNTFKASYADFDGKYATGIDFSEVYMYIDGVDVTDKCYINEGDEEIYFYDASLSNGDHNITVSVADKFGNSTSETRYFKVEGDSDITSATIVEAAGAPVLGSDYIINVVSDNASDILAADVAVSITSNFVRYWNNFDVVAGEGYVVNGTSFYNTVDNSINFSVVKDENTENTDNVIAQIVIHIPTNVPEDLAVTYKVVKGALTLASEISDNTIAGFSGQITNKCESPFIITVDTMIVGSDGNYITVTDSKGEPVADVNIYTNEDVLVGVTDENGKLFTDKYVGSVQKFSIYAEKDGVLSFVYTGQSYPAGGAADGMPSYIKLNATKSPATSQSITWMSNPLSALDKTVVLYAEKSAYEAKGDEALKEYTGTSFISEMASSATMDTNYAVRINKALITGLKPSTEYVYFAGDGVNMSAVKSFSTSRDGAAVNFFVIGDTQATDTTNTDEITKNLASSGIKFDFGIQTGDAVDNGGNYTMWANIAKVFSGDFLGEQDLIQVLGNHEYYGDGNAHNSASYFDLPDTAEDGSAPGYYSLQYGNVYVAVINYGNASEYKKAAEWLKTDAANTNATWKILAMHQPAYYTNPAGSNDSLQEILVPAIDEAGINVVFSGHDHSYARTKAMTAGNVSENGTVYYICGSTGEKSYEIVENEAFNFATLVDDYNATYLTVTATDTALTVNTYDYTDNGTTILIDSMVMNRDVDCKDGGHDYTYADGYLKCSVCGYTVSSDSYTGLVSDAETGKAMYFLAGKAMTGWFVLGNDNYCFDKNGLAQTGKITIDGHTYTFGEDGKMILGSLEKTSDGRYSYYINGTLQRGWFFINGYWYYFSRSNGFKTLKGTEKVEGRMYTFTDDGKLVKGAWNVTDIGTSYYWGPDPVIGLQEIEGETYYFYPDSTYMCTDSVEINGTVYAFNTDGTFAHYGAHNDRTYVKTVDATCKDDGYIHYTCKDENGDVRDEYVVLKAEGHADANKDYICDKCGKAAGDSLIDFLRYIFGKFYQIINRIFGLFS